MRKLLLLLILFLFGNTVFALNIVYPKTHNVTVNSPTIFFIGSSKNPVTINGEEIALHSSGGFAYFVNLKDGQNLFEIKSKKQHKTYTITKAPQDYEIEPALSLYETPKYLEVLGNNIPLRSTPKDSGINRISHLQKGVLLTSDGEQSDFCHIVLAKDKFAWINKKHVSPTEIYEYAELKEQESFEDKNFTYFAFRFDKKIPFEIVERNGISLKFYNIKDNDFYEFNYPTENKLLGYSGEYIGNKFVLKIRKPIVINKEKPLKNITITVDAGHGGNEFGAIGCFGDKEKDINLKFAKYLKKELKKHGAKVVMTRNSDKKVGLYERVKIANKNNSMIFVSIHNNALPDTLDPNTHQGTSVYYYYNASKPLAESILGTMTEDLDTNDDGIHQESFAVVRNTEALSVLIEVGYLINPDDNVLLLNKKFQKQTAKAIRKGIENYLLSDILTK